MASFPRWLWRYRKYLFIFLPPLLILPLPLVIQGMEARCGYVLILMTLYWCTECLPMSITALLPVIFFPMMGIMKSSDVCSLYITDASMLGFGGFLLAIAVENWNLHKRIAFQVMLLVGVKPALLMMGFMVSTAFLSMWISSTATTAMMLPITNAVLQLLRNAEEQADERDLGLVAAKAGAEGLENQAFEMGDTKVELESKEFKTKESINMDKTEENAKAEQTRLKTEQNYMRLSRGMSLSVCYAASIGGTATLTGSAPNLILKGQVDKLFPGNGEIINFASWFGFSFPNMVLMLALSWMWLQFMYLGFNMKSFSCGGNKDNDKDAYQVMKNEYKKLGRMGFAEIIVLVEFVLLVILWFTREPGFMPGWATVLFNQKETFVTDGTVAIVMSMLFFIIPSQMPRCGDISTDGSPLNAPSTLLNWDIVNKKMPWNIIFLLGGGFALAKGSEISGLSLWLGESLTPLQSLPPFGISILLCLLIATFTECSSNATATTLFLPILASMATAIKLHPLYVMLPCSICASLAFMLPVASPPNAIAYSYGNFTVLDMAKTGFILNILGVVTINIALNTWGAAMFNLNTFPDWANVTTPL